MNEPIRWVLSSGYRNDRLHWHLQNPGDDSAVTYREVYPSLSFWENALSIQTIYRDLVFFLRGSYGAFGEGTLNQRYSDLSFTSDTPEFRFSTHGWAADASCVLGYAVNLTAERHYLVALSPLIGFTSHFEHLYRKGSTPFSGTLTPALGSTPFTMNSSLPGSLEQTWYGLCVGGGFFIRPNDRCSFQVAYLYNWLHLIFKNQQSQSLASVPEAAAPATLNESMKVNRKGNLGQTGWISGDLALTQKWRLGLGAYIRYNSSQVLDASIQDGSATRSEKFKARWTQVAGWVQGSREF